LRGVLADDTDRCVAFWQMILTVAWGTGGMMVRGSWCTGR